MLSPMRKSVRSRGKKSKSKSEEGLLASGVLRVHARGFGFLVPDDRGRFPQDIFVPKHLVKGAVDGDRVKVEVNIQVQSEKGPEGRVVTIVERGRSEVGGILIKKEKKEALIYIPFLGQSYQPMRMVLPERPSLQLGDRIVVKVDKWSSTREEGRGLFHHFIGPISDPSCDTQSAIAEFELRDAFPEGVLEEVKAFGTRVSPKEIKGREDLRELETFTIDPETARDYDDALSLSQDGEGNFHLAVHIADVSHYVKPDTALDEEARSRCNSTYFPGTVVPMLPHALSSHLCSLMPDVNRLAVSVLVKLDPTGHILETRIARSVIRSAKRFTYEEAKEVLDGKLESRHQKTLFLMVDLCHRLKKRRYLRGSIEFSFPDVQLLVDEKGVPSGIKVVEYDITHQLVEEFMLLANEIVATHLSKQGKPLAYRIHEEPSETNLRDFAALAGALGFSLPKQPTTEELQKLFDEARNSPIGQFLATAFIRSMKLAIYSTQNIGHYGLSLEHYTHFTSPIRRYIDLVVHRLLLGESPGDDLDAIAERCSEQERLSAKAENSVLLLKKVRLLNQLKEQEPERVYAAVVTAVKPFGFAFDVVDFLFDGFLTFDDLEDDYFVYDEQAKRLVGSRTQKSYQTGDRLELKLHHVDLVTKEVGWRLAAKGRR